MTHSEATARFEYICKMREDGCTFEEIGRKVGLSKQRVQQILRRGGHMRKRGLNKNRPVSVYTNLEAWAVENNCSWSELANRCGLHAELFYRSFVHGLTKSPGKRSIDKLLEITGLTYEQLFQKELTA